MVNYPVIDSEHKCCLLSESCGLPPAGFQGSISPLYFNLQADTRLYWCRLSDLNHYTSSEEDTASNSWHCPL